MLNNQGATRAADMVAGAENKLLDGIVNALMQEWSCERKHAEAAASRIVKCPDRFTYDPWRHGGWYVHEVTHPSGATGCVSRNYDDRKWRIVCDSPHEVTFTSREDAARGEHALALEGWKRRIFGNI